MSLFGSKYETYYSSTSSVLFEDVPSILKQTIGTAITQNRNISKDLVTNLVNGVGYQVDRLYNYALAEDGYPYGLPNGSTGSYPQNMYSNVEAIIEEVVGSKIYLVTCAIVIDTVNSSYVYNATYQLKSYNDVIAETVYTWTYNTVDDLYDLLKVADDFDIGNSPYYPIIPIRENNQSTVADGQPNAAKIKYAAKMIGINAESISDSIEEQSATGDNPVEDAFVIIGTEITNKTEVGLNYLYAFCNHLISISTYDQESHRAWLVANSGSTPPMNTITISDASYKMQLGWAYVEESLITGELGDIGKVTSYISSGSGEVDVGDSNFSTNVFVINKQVTTTQYNSIKVYGLVHTNWAIGKELRTTLDTAFNGDDEDVAQCFIIPLRKDLLQEVGTLDKHDLMYTAIRLVVNDKLRVKLKWYQTGWFQAVILVIALVISVWFPPAGIAAFSAAAVGYALVQIIAMKILLPLVVSALEDVIGEELALLVSVLVSAYLGDFSAGAIATAGMQAASGAYSIYIASELEKIQAEMELMEDLLEEVEDEERDYVNRTYTAVALSQADTFNTFKANEFVARVQYDNKIPVLIRDVTTNFTSISQYVSRPTSMIRLGQDVSL